MLHKSLAAVVLGTAAAAAQAAGPSGGSSLLYVSSFSGKVTALAFDRGAKEAAGGGAVPTLKNVSQAELGGVQSFLALDAKRNVLYTCEEGFQSADGNGTLFALQVEQNGSMMEMSRQKTAAGCVFLEPVGASKDTIAIPHFGGKALSVWNVANQSNMVEVQRENFDLPQPGPKPQQTEAKPHQALLDPTGNFMVAPDLGADLLRLFSVAPSGNTREQQPKKQAASSSGGGDCRERQDQGGKKNPINGPPTAKAAAGDQLLQRLDPVSVKPGSGPRHAAFAVAGSKTYMYVVTELSSEIMGFDVAYPAGGGMKLNPLFTMKVHGKDESKTPEFAAASEIAVSPDNQFLIVSSRNESTLSVPSFDGGNGKNGAADVVSDSLSNYRIDPATGALGELQIRVPSGGRFPRHFSMSADGAFVAVANQLDGRVVVMKRDPKSGMLGGFVGQALLDGNVTSVIFRE